jgi:hypothetical protein
MVRGSARVWPAADGAREALGDRAHRRQQRVPAAGVEPAARAADADERPCRPVRHGHRDGEARERGLELRVALRPDAVGLGAQPSPRRLVIVRGVKPSGRVRSAHSGGAAASSPASTSVPGADA